MNLTRFETVLRVLKLSIFVNRDFKILYIRHWPKMIHFNFYKNLRLSYLYVHIFFLFYIFLLSNDAEVFSLHDRSLPSTKKFDKLLY